MMKLSFRTLAMLSAAALAIHITAAEAQAPDPAVTLFINVNVFDGMNEALIENANVVVTGNLITAVSTEPLAVAGGRVIDGGGRTLMPGLIDMHRHSAYASVIKPGADADLILVDGNPLEDIDLIADPENNLLIIMKDGVIYKNTLK